MLHEKIKALEARLTELAEQEYGVACDTVATAKARIESVINTTLEALAEMRAGPVGSVSTHQQLSVDLANNRCWADVRVTATEVKQTGDEAVFKERVRQTLARNLANFIAGKMKVHEEYDVNRDHKIYRAEVYAFSPEEIGRRYTIGSNWWCGYEDMYVDHRQVYDPKSWDVIAEIDEKHFSQSLARMMEQAGVVKPQVQQHIPANRSERRGGKNYFGEVDWYNEYRPKPKK